MSLSNSAPLPPKRVAAEPTIEDVDVGGGEACCCCCSWGGEIALLLLPNKLSAVDGDDDWKWFGDGDGDSELVGDNVEPNGEVCPLPFPLALAFTFDFWGGGET